MPSVRVVVVDDVEDWRRLVTSLLKQEAGVEVVGEADDGLKAVQLAEKLRPSVIVLDMSLPGLSGMEACEWIGKVAPGTKVVFLSLYREPDMVKAALKAGAVAYIVKSDTLGELLAAVETVMHGEIYLSRCVLEQNTRPLS